MCIIVAKLKGSQLPTKNTLKMCFEHNKDGAGLMYVKNNKVVIEKGFMTFGEFWHKIKLLKKEFNSDLTDKALVMHFRIGTHGENDKATTHPFPISGNAEDLRATYFETDLGMAHNGVMSYFNYDDILSDTQSFIKDYVSVFKELNKNFIKNDRVVKLILDKANINYNKLCFLDKNENIYWFGDRVVDNGIIYSNTTYKEPKKYNNYKTTYSYCWDEDWEDWYSSNYKSSTPKEYEELDTLEDFTRRKVKYEVLECGDIWASDMDGDVVRDTDILIIDEKHNLYECIGDRVSLIETNVVVYNKSYELKPLSF